MSEFEEGQGPTAVAEAADGPSDREDDRSGEVAVEATSDAPPPWPAGHEPATPGERALWHSFASLRAVSDGPLTAELVATRIGMSRTPISKKTEGFRLLREAIRDEVLRRRDRRRAAKAPAPRLTPAERAAAREARQEESVNYWKAVAQRADSATQEVKAAAVRAEGRSRTLATVARRALDDIRSGRWQRVDDMAVDVADLAAILGPQPRLPGGGTGAMAPEGEG